MSAFQEYRKSVEESRAWFLGHHAAVVTSFDLVNAGFDELARCLREGRTANGKSQLSLVPLLLISQRQAFMALESLSVQQSYQAWVLLRPGVEAALIMGKWMEDRQNFEVWTQRSANPKAYRNAYSGQALVSRSLPRSADIQASLKTINDLFTHPNPEYYWRHSDLSRLDQENYQLKLHFFDDQATHWASILAMLHLLLIMQESLAQMLASIFVNLEVDAERYGRSQFEGLHLDAAAKAAKTDSTSATIIHDIGLWPR